MSSVMAPMAICALLLTIVLMAGCERSHDEPFTGPQTPAPADWTQLAVDSKQPCYLELAGPRRIKVWCFAVNDVLHIQSNRFSMLPRPWGENWVDSVARNPLTRISVAGRIHLMRAEVIGDKALTRDILADRGYGESPPAGIRVVRFRRP